jgi:hypothetical protein
MLIWRIVFQTQIHGLFQGRAAAATPALPLSSPKEKALRFKAFRSSVK